MKMLRVFIFLMAVLMLAITISGPALAALCISSNASTIPSGVQNKDAFTSTLSQQNAKVDVTIQNFAYNPSNITVANGTTVVWTNKDTSSTHTVTSDAKVTDTNGTSHPVFFSGNLSPGASFEFQFNTTGTFGYHCSRHSSMHGTVVVT